MLRVLPLASCKLATSSLVSRVTVLVPLMMHAFVEASGTPLFQFPGVLQVPLPSIQLDPEGDVHWMVWALAGRVPTEIRRAMVRNAAAGAACFLKPVFHQLETETGRLIWINADPPAHT